MQGFRQYDRFFAWAWRFLLRSYGLTSGHYLDALPQKATQPLHAVLTLLIMTKHIRAQLASIGCGSCAMHVHRLYSSAIVTVSATTCCPRTTERGSPEVPGRHSLAFVRQGAYCYHGSGEGVIIDPLTVLAFAEGEEYAVSHPLGCGDNCLDVWIGDDELREARPAFRKAEKMNGGRARSNIFPISSEIRRDVCILAQRLERDRLSNLEVEESVLSILRTVGDTECSAEGCEAGRARAGNRSRSRKKVEWAKELVLSDLGRNWSLKEISDLVGVSPFHLTRLVRGFAGETLHQFLTRQRLAVAMHRIAQGANDLTALALDLGFSSHSHFSASFKREYGQSPSSLRKLI